MLPTRKSIRLYGFDYHNISEYFVTIVTQHRKPLFAQILNSDLILTEAGKMVKETILDMPNQFPEVELEQFIVMPNHVHLLIDKHAVASSLADIVQWFKSVTTAKYAHAVKQNGWPPYPYRLWQRNYYEHIVRNNKAHDYIAQYIYDNPMRWVHDKLNPKCINPDHVMRTILSFGQVDATTTDCPSEEQP